MFFFEKKNQKTFPGAARRLSRAPNQRGAAHLKVFCFFFSKKKRFLLFAYLP
jgi:hypothetical protein